MYIFIIIIIIIIIIIVIVIIIIIIYLFILYWVKLFWGSKQFTICQYFQAWCMGQHQRL